MRRLLAIVACGALAFVAVTLVALEGREVVVVETADGAHRTRTWIADDGDGAWIEAANPERPFVADLHRSPALVLERGGVRRRCSGDLVSNPGGHERVRRLLRDRYGWADRWIGMLADTRASLAVRVRCA
jgi:hypothetical protein